MVTGLLCSPALLSGALLSRSAKFSFTTTKPWGAPRFWSKRINLAAVPRCLIHGVSGGGFWEGADGDNAPASNWPPSAKGNSTKDNSMLLSLIQEIEPLDVSLIQKDVSTDTMDAMKRTISGMLGLLPSDQFHVLIEAFWEPLSRLLVSSMMTGYTLRNAEYRLCLQKNIDISEEYACGREQEEAFKVDNSEDLVDGRSAESCLSKISKRSEMPSRMETASEEDAGSCELDIPDGLGELSPEAQDYIHSLQYQLSLVSNKLQESQQKSAAFKMQNLVGDEKNDLLDYLRSLEPEKVAELSEPTSSEIQEAIQRVIHGLLATLSPKMQSKTPPQYENGSAGVRRSSDEEGADMIENASLQFQPLVSVTRDYLARLLFWCMLLGHYMRGLEYRLELTRMLRLSGDIELSVPDGRQLQ